MDAMERAVELGHRNREVLELARHHCAKLEFRQNMGRGLAEEATGLPINTREVFCEVGGRGSTASDLARIAGEYVRQHCRGCPSRKPTGHVPNLLTEVDAADARVAEQEEARRAAAKEALAASERRRTVRAAILAAADEGTVQLRADLDLVDSAVRENPDAASGAFRRLDAIARRASELFGPELVEQLFCLVRDQHVDRLLRPLRYLARSAATPAAGVLALALRVLEERPSADAAACLAEFSSDLPQYALTRGTVDSCVRLIAGPVYSRLGHRETPHNADPAGFLAIADADLPLVLDHVTTLLTAAAPEPSRLLLPPGSAQRSSGERARDAEGAEMKRHQGAVAARFLFAARRCGWSELGGALLQALAQPDHDDFDPVTSHEVRAAIAEALLSEFDVVFADLSSEMPDSPKHAERLVDCLGYVERLLDPDDRFLHRHFEPAHVQQLATALCQATVSLLDERWGMSSAHHVADLVEKLAQHFPDAMSVHADSLLGHLLLESAAGEPPKVRLLTPLDPLQAMEQVHQSVMRDVTGRDLRHAIAHCAAAQPVRVLEAVLSADAVQIDPGPTADQAATKHVRDTRRHCLLLACEIAEKHGTQPGVLPRVLPLLYRRLLGEDQSLRAAAIRGWASLARKYPLPSSLADCGPALLEDTYLIVLSALVEHGERILHERDIPSLVMRATGLAAGYAADEQWTKMATSALYLVFANRDLYPEDGRPAVERWILSTARNLPNYEARDVANLHGWSRQAATSAEMAYLRLAFVDDPQINDRFNDHEDQAYVRLCEVGEGGRALSYDEVRRSAIGFLPDRPWGAALLVEALQCFGRWQEAHVLAQFLHASMPAVPAYEGYRSLLADVLEHAALQADTASHDEDRSTAAANDRADRADEADDVAHQVATVTRARRALRAQTSDVQPANQGALGAERLDRFRAAAEQLKALSAQIPTTHPNLTPSADYLRRWATGLSIAGHLLQAHAAARDADVPTEKAHRRAAALRAEEALTLTGYDNPLCSPLQDWLRQIAANNPTARPDALASALANLPVPLCLARGRSLTRKPPYQDAADSKPAAQPVVVCLSWIDERMVSFTQVLQPHRAYTLRLQLRMEQWPAWADGLDVELLSVVGPDELVLPSFSWSRSDAAEAGEFVSVGGEKTLLLRFALGAGQPPQAVRIMARFRAADGRTEMANLAGYTELRLRPFDPTRDALTDFPQLDERLLAINDRVRQLTDDEPTLQAFSRLLAAVTAVAAELTYDQTFRRGTNVSEKKFHDEVDARLKQDPLLEGRVLRATRQGLGITDVVHDGVTCELKVERSVAFGQQRAKHYLGQPTQYASAVQKQLSILLVLDTTTKTQPVGVQANYLWLMKPELHGGTDSAAHPALVAVVVANSNLTVPSNWSRRTIAAEDISLE